MSNFGCEDTKLIDISYVHDEIMKCQLRRCLTFDQRKWNMSIKNQYIGLSLRILFIVVVGIFYAILTSINPFPILNILIWLTLLWIFKSVIKETKIGLTRIGLIVLFTMLLAYLIPGVKSAFFISEFNQLYLGEDELGLFPNLWSSETTNVLISFSVWYKKVSFAFIQEVFYYNFGTSTISIGLLVTKTIKIIEILWLTIFAGLNAKDKNT